MKHLQRCGVNQNFFEDDRTTWQEEELLPIREEYERLEREYNALDDEADKAPAVTPEIQDRLSELSDRMWALQNEAVKVNDANRAKLEAEAGHINNPMTEIEEREWEEFEQKGAGKQGRAGEIFDKKQGEKSTEKPKTVHENVKQQLMDLGVKEEYADSLGKVKTPCFSINLCE
jgi:chromosome segregation ATPase